MQSLRSATARVLVVDDEEVIRTAVKDFLGSWEVTTAPDAEAGVRALRSEVFDVILTDVCMPGGGGEALARRALEELPHASLLVMSGQGTLEDLRTFLRLGACDYLLKPLTPDRVQFAVSRAVELGRLRRAARRDGSDPIPRRPPERLLGESRVMAVLKSRLAQVAGTESTVLLHGETGTGKELAARAIHDLSERAKGPFVAVNCGALPESLLESVLFGHARGAFTGADASRPGCFEQAHGGTLFLDELAATSKRLQVRLLRVLSSREVARLGEGRCRPVDTRIVGATNEDLDALVRSGRFRDDLYYRLAVVPVQLPSLRSRGPRDIELLAIHFLREACDRMGRPPMALSSGGLDRLLAHPWPGNVRELANAMERAVILAHADGRVEAEHVVLRPVESGGDPGLSLPAEGLDLKRTLATLERSYIEQALARCGGNRREAAALLRLRRTTLAEKLRRQAPPGGDGPARPDSP